MTNSEKFKAAHKLAKTYKGDYIACFSLALKEVNASPKETYEFVIGDLGIQLPYVFRSRKVEQYRIDNLGHLRMCRLTEAEKKNLFFEFEYEEYNKTINGLVFQLQVLRKGGEFWGASCFRGKLSSNEDGLVESNCRQIDVKEDGLQEYLNFFK